MRKSRAQQEWNKQILPHVDGLRNKWLNMKFKLIKTINRKNKNVISQIRKRRTQKGRRSCDLNSSAFTKGNYHLKLIKQEMEVQDFKT